MDETTPPQPALPDAHPIQPAQVPPAPHTTQPLPPPPQHPLPNGPQSAIPAAPAALRMLPVGGVIYGLLAALVGGVAWYFVTVLSDRQFVYLAILFGALVGSSVSAGARGKGIITGAIGAVIAALGAVASYYFIDRHFINEGLKDLGATTDLPLFGSFDNVREVLRLGFEAEPSQYLFSLLAVGAGAVLGYIGIGPGNKLYDWINKPRLN